MIAPSKRCTPLGNLYGRKKLFLFAITLFIGSDACSVASSMAEVAEVVEPPR